MGGGPLRHGRGKAFWRDGDGYNISLNTEKNCFYDFAAGEGGGVLDLIQLVSDCTREDALRWLAVYCNISLVSRPLSRAEKRAYADARAAEERDVRDARWFARAATASAEETLEALGPADPERESLTALLAALHTEAGQVSELRAWREAWPELTAAMIVSGRKSDARAQRELALLVALVAEVEHAAPA